MKECKPIKVPIPVGVKLSGDQCPKAQDEEEDMSHVPCECSWKFDVGNGFYQTVHCTCSESFEQVYVKIREGALTTVKRVFKYLCVTPSYGL